MKKKTSKKKKKKETMTLLPEEYIQYQFGFSDIFRLLLIFIGFVLPLFFVLIYWGLIIGLMLVVLFEVSGIKRMKGILIDNKTEEEHPIFEGDFWYYLHKILFFWLILSFVLIILFIF